MPAGSIHDKRAGMSAKESTTPPTSESIAQYVKKNAAKVKAGNKAGDHHGGGETVREAQYEGHHIVVRTTYHVAVDGRPITGHMGVTDDGQVHYHAVPNLAYASAIDLLKALIDIFPDDFSPRAPGALDHGRSARATPSRRRKTSHPVGQGKSK